MSTYDMTQSQLNEILSTTVSATTEALIQQYLQAAQPTLYPVSGYLQTQYGPTPGQNQSGEVNLKDQAAFYINTLPTSYDPLTDTMTGYTDTMAPGSPNVGPASSSPVETFYTVDGKFIAAGDTTVRMIDETGGTSVYADTLIGGLGNDKITAIQGYNVLVAGNGANTLHGGTGFDSLYGAGNSYLSSGSGNDSLYGVGNDTLNAGNTATGNTAYLQGQSTSPNGLTMYGSDAAGSVTIFDDQLSSGNDLMKSNGGNDSIWGGAGNDTIKAGTGMDHIWNGTGADTIYGAQAGGTDITMLDYGATTDFIGGQGGTDRLNVGPTGNDTITGGGSGNTAVTVYNTTSYTENTVTIGGQAYQDITFANGQSLTVKGVAINFIAEGTHQTVN